MTKNILRGVTLAVIGFAALALSACGTAGSGFETTYRTTERLAPEQYAATETTSNYMIDTLTGYDEQGYKLPARDLTYEENILVGSTDQYCAVRAADVEGLAMTYLQNGAAFSILGAIGQAAGALGVPGADLASYAYLGAGSFGASSVATTRILVKQGLTILHATCMANQLRSDARGRRLTVYPVIAGQARRPRTGTEHSEPLDSFEEPSTDETPMTTPIVPM